MTTEKKTRTRKAKDGASVFQLAQTLPLVEKIKLAKALKEIVLTEIEAACEQARSLSETSSNL